MGSQIANTKIDNVYDNVDADGDVEMGFVGLGSESKPTDNSPLRKDGQSFSRALLFHELDESDESGDLGFLHWPAHPST